MDTIHKLNNVYKILELEENILELCIKFFFSSKYI